MGYLVKRQQQRARTGMSGWTDNETLIGIGQVVVGLGGGQTLISVLQDSARLQNETCLSTASSQPSIKALDDQIMQLAKEWRPSGYYTIDQVQRIVASVVPFAAAAMVSLGAAPHTTSNAATMVKERMGKLVARTDESKIYIAACAEAKRMGADVVDSPGLRRWVMNSLQDVSAAMVTTYVLNCNTTFIDTLASWLGALGDFLLSLAKIVVKAGQLVLKVPDAIAQMWTAIKYGALAGGAYFVYAKFLKPRLKA